MSAARTLSRLPRLALLSLLGTAACDREGAPPSMSEVPVPSPGSVRVPQLTPDSGGGAIASWLEHRAGGGYRLQLAVLRDGAWSAARTVVEDDSIFMHPTDLPSVTRLVGGALAAVWQRQVNKPTSGDGWQYELRVQFSKDDGATWSAPVSPHPGSTAGGEHEFHSAWPTADGGVGLAWIDPREQKVVPAADSTGEAAFLGAMQLVTSTITPDGTVHDETIVDDVICECCPTSVATVRGQPLIAYRDKRVPADVPHDSLRYEMMVLRDLSLARRQSDAAGSAHWQSGQRVTEDGWLFNGCPNNGPALAASGDTVALAWWTGEGDDPRVQLRWSYDGGERFGTPLRITEGRADGQVAVALADGGTYVAWLQDREVMLRFVTSDGTPGPAIALGRSGGRHRLPTLMPRAPRGILAGWSGDGERWQLRAVEP